MFADYLIEPDQDLWRKAVFCELLGAIDVEGGTHSSDSGELESILTAIPELHRDEFNNDLPQRFYLGRLQSTKEPEDVVAEVWTILDSGAISNSPNPSGIQLVSLLHDEHETATPEWREHWAGMLWLWNKTQFLDQTWWTTTKGIKQEGYDVLPVPYVTASSHSEWTEVTELTELPNESVFFLEISGIPTPEVGYEITDSDGMVIGQAEMAWEVHKLALLGSYFANQEIGDKFIEQGWNILYADQTDVLDTIVDTLKGG